MNTGRVAALMRELAELDAQRSDVQRKLALALEEPEPEERAEVRRTVARPEPTIPVDEMTRAKTRRLLRRSGVAPR